MNFIRAHPLIALALVFALLMVVIGFTVYRAGERKAATAAAVQLLDTQRVDQQALALESKQARDSANVLTGKLHDANAISAARGDSLALIATERKAAAATVRLRMVLTADTATIVSDSGSVKYSLPMPVAKQFAEERETMDSAYATLSRRTDSLISLDSGRVKEIGELHVVVSLDSVTTKRMNDQLATANNEIVTLKKAGTPRFSAAEGFLAGAATALAAIATLAVIF
jgi:lipopolysaccharide export LptBFGC system permease protein LptF